MEVIVATLSKPTHDEVLRINHLFENGLTCLHVRRSKVSRADVLELMELIPRRHHDKIVIHGHYSLAKKYKTHGIHLRRKHRTKGWKNNLRRLALKLKFSKSVLCTSFHSVQSLRDSNLSPYDYVILTKVYSSDNNLDRYSVKLLKSLLGKLEKPVYAMGGVDKTRLSSVIEAGFQGVVLSSAIFSSPIDEYMSHFEAFAAN